MTNRIKAILTALLLLTMIGSAMCAPTELPDRAATQAELKAIDDLQKKIDEKGYKWTAGITSVSLLTDDEKKKLCGVKPIDDLKDKDVKEKKEKKPKDVEPVGTFPSTFDWRNKDGINWMTPVWDQGCGDCWAFSAIGVVEAKINIQANDPNLDVDLSEQHLVSSCCSAGDCGGGWPGQALSYIKYTGVPEEACFLYRGGDSACEPCDNWNANAWNGISYSSISQSNYKDSISSHGPISAAIKVYEDLFDYTGGVYQHTAPATGRYHAITVVGWNDTEGCWIIKNSWGEGWGEDGYGRIPGSYFPYYYTSYTVTAIGDYVPRAEAYASPENGTAPLTVAFTGIGTDHDGTIVSYEWDFGDGTNSTSQNPTHTYTDLGIYTAALSVTDNDGHVGLDSVVVTSGEIITPVSASASTFFDYDCLPENAIDGDLETYWLSGICDNPCWIIFDFGEQMGIHSAYMSMRTGSGYSTFDVLASNDSTTWGVVSEDVSTLDYVTADVMVNMSHVRYVKLDIDNPNVVEGCREFYAIRIPPCEVYDTNGEPGIQKPEAINAINDYLFLEIISQETAMAVLDCYNNP